MKKHKITPHEALRELERIRKYQEKLNSEKTHPSWRVRAANMLKKLLKNEDEYRRIAEGYNENKRNKKARRDWRDVLDE